MASLLGSGVRSPSEYDDPSVKLWFHRLDQGIKRRKEEMKQWKRNEDFLEGKHWSGTYGDGDDIRVNLTAAYCETRLAEIAFRNPRAKLTPENPTGYEQVEVPVIDPESGPQMQVVGDPRTGLPIQVPVTRTVSRHKVVEELLNKVATKGGIAEANRRCVLAGQLAYGCIMTGYKPELKPEALDRRKEPEEDEFGTPMWGNYEIDPVTGQPYRDKEGYLIPVDGGVVHDKWFVDYAHYRQIIIDPDGGNDFRDHSWVAIEYTLPLKRVKKDPQYKNTDNLTATGTMDYEPSSENDDEPAFNDRDNLDPYVKDETEAVRLFRIYDLDNKEIIVLADGYGEYLQEKPLPLGIDHSPLSFYRPMERLGKNGEFYPKAPLNDIVPINDEYNKHRKMLMTKARKETRKYAILKGAISDDEMGKLTSPNDMEFVQVDLAKSTANTLQEAIMPVVYQSVGGDAFAYGKNIVTDFSLVSGTSPEAFGSPKSETATQVENMQLHMSLRTDFQRTKMGETLKGVYKKLLDSIQANMTQEQAIMLMGPDGQAFQTMVNEDMIVGDYDVDIDVEEMAPRNRNMQLAQFNNLMANVVQGLLPLLADQRATEAIFDMYGIKDQRIIDGISHLAQQAMQMQQAQAQQQMQQQQMAGAKDSEKNTPANEADAIAQLAGGMQ